MQRTDVTFTSGDAQCAAWLYRPPALSEPLACVVMAYGFSLTRHDGLPAYAERLAEAGIAVLVFDHRYLGDSGGEPRQRFRKRDQLADWRNEISPAVFLSVAMHRPLAKARNLRAPLWVGLGEQDVSVSRRAVERLAERAPQGELHRYPYDHFGAFLGDGPQRVATDQIEFLGRQGLLAR